jgi:peptide-methionine (S)-S-oxide reductase
MKNLSSSLLFLLITSFSIVSCAQSDEKTIVENTNKQKNNNLKMDTATFGAGCFWCVEAIFQQINGVQSVSSGYSGGTVKNPSYKEVCTGATGHAEVCQIVYDPSKVTYDEMLEAFWSSHDPTTLNKQGGDEGTQYRSVIFYHNQEQKMLAEKYKKKLNDEKAFDNPVLTEISPYTEFYKAENYHQDYYNQNKDSNPYCSFVIAPKLDKFKKVFKHKLKEN